jgi:hypothetical protein
MKDKTLSEKVRVMKMTIGDKWYLHKDVKEAVEKLKLIGLKKTIYPKYLMLTKEDIDSIFGSFE